MVSVRTTFPRPAPTPFREQAIRNEPQPSSVRRSYSTPCNLLLTLSNQKVAGAYSSPPQWQEASGGSWSAAT